MPRILRADHCIGDIANHVRFKVAQRANDLEVTIWLGEPCSRLLDRFWSIFGFAETRLESVVKRLPQYVKPKPLLCGDKDSEQPVYFDLETVALLTEVLEEAWLCLPLSQRAITSRTFLAEGLLKAAAKGERDRKRLIDAAMAGISIAA